MSTLKYIYSAKYWNPGMWNYAYTTLTFEPLPLPLVELAWDVAELDLEP